MALLFARGSCSTTLPGTELSCVSLSVPIGRKTRREPGEKVGDTSVVLFGARLRGALQPWAAML